MRYNINCENFTTEVDEKVKKITTGERTGEAGVIARGFNHNFLVFQYFGVKLGIVGSFLFLFRKMSRFVCATILTWVSRTGLPTLRWWTFMRSKLPGILQTCF